MSPVQTAPPRSLQLRRRGLAAVATAAGVGASLSLLALSQSTASSSATIDPVAAAGTTSAVGAAAPVTELLTAAVPKAVPAPAAKVPVARVAPDAPAAGTAPHAMAAAADSCSGVQAAADPFVEHMYAAHLEPSLTQQVADIGDVDRYVQAHTVLVGNILKPLLGGATSSLDSFLQHAYAAHLEASPTQQVADIGDADQYVKTHTVMLEQMVKPLAGSC